MVSLDQLAALDLLLWLTGSARAARLERTNQSTIVRRSQAVEACFGVEIRREPSGWHLAGDRQLLQMERHLHQQARLLGHRPLRLHAPFWTQKTRLRRLPQGWCVNPATASAVCENPVELLRARVIDAVLLTPTQMPQPSDDLACVDIYRSRIELSVFASPETSDPLLSCRKHMDQGDLVLRQPSFLPESCLRRCREWFAALPVPQAARAPDTGRRSQTTALSVAFLTPEMQQVQGLPCVVDPTVEPRPYVERLLMRRDLAGAAPLLRLQEHLSRLCGSSGDSNADRPLRAA